MVVPKLKKTASRFEVNFHIRGTDLLCRSRTSRSSFSRSVRSQPVTRHPASSSSLARGRLLTPSPKINSRFCRHSARSASSFPFAIPFLNSAPRAPFFPPSIPLSRTRLQDLACSGAASLSRGIGAVQRNSKSIYFLRKGPGGKAPSRR